MKRIKAMSEKELYTLNVQPIEQIYTKNVQYVEHF